jgi:hypothetical protein
MKDWLIQVGIKKFGPSAIRAAVAAFIAFVVANRGMLESFGVFYDDVTNILTIHLNTATSGIILFTMASIGGLVKVLNHPKEIVAPKKQEEPVAPEPK